MLVTDQVLHKGRYRIINSFGPDKAAGMYQAYDTVSNAAVVLQESSGRFPKVTTPGQLEEINAEFAGRARSLQAARHESLVTVQDHFSEVGRQFLVLEELTGQDLGQYVSAGGARASLGEVFGWIDQLLGALSYLHKLSPPVIHGDIRPWNLKLTSGKKIKLLTDPAAGPGARVQVRERSDENALTYQPLEQIWPGLDATSQRVILNNYDEPAAEILLRDLDVRSDIYSVGATFYHLLTGHAPADALDRSIALLEGKPDTLPSPAQIDSTIAPEISDTILRAMAVRREDRFDSAVIMQQIFRTAVARTKERLTEARRSVPAASDKVEPMPKVPVVAEVSLELEREKPTDRAHEIEVEQARLDAERKRIEQRQLELAAEKERHAAERDRLEREALEERIRLEKEKLEHEAEQERQRIAQRLADLEAERVRERAEEERLEKEAEAERRRAEERLGEIRAGQERHRAEQQRIAAEAQAERERAELRLMELSGNGFSAPAPSGVADAEPITNAGAQTYDAAGADNVAVPAFLEQPAGSRRFAAIAISMVVLAAAAAGGWMLFSPGAAGPDRTAQLPVLAAKTPAPLSTQSVSSLPAQPEEQNAAIPVEPPPDTQPEAQTDTPLDPAVGAVKRMPATAAVSERRAKPAPDKKPAAKKPVTVDDLINDN